jgi:peptidyl-prolyl cis-trans isomerase D
MQDGQSMLQFIRKLLSSKIGALLGVLFVVLLGLLFAAGDVGSMFSGHSGVSGGMVARVGREEISEATLSKGATSALERAKQQTPSLTMKDFLASGGLGKVLDEMIDRSAITDFGRRHGIVASDRLVDSEIAQVPAFQGPDGNFSQALFEQAVHQRGLNEQMVREDLAQGLIVRQVLFPAAFGASAPRYLAQQFASLITEHRTGAIAVLPSQLFLPAKLPSDAELETWYKQHTAEFVRPERRTIRYASFGPEVLKTAPQPTDAEIAARYKADAAKYAALETRTVTQVIVPTQAAANAVIAEVKGGKSLAAAAREKGLATSTLDSVSKTALAGQTSQAVADAAFSAAKGSIAATAKGPLGWHVMRVDAVQTRPARSLDQVRGEIAKALAEQKQRAALNDLIGRIEDEFDSGGNLTDAAKELGVTLKQSPPLTSNGQVYGKPGEKAPDVLGKALQTAFSMEQENQPQIAEVDPGKTFLIFDVSEIQASAPAPFNEIKNDVKTAYMLDKGQAAAKQAAEKVQAQVKKGGNLAKALASLGKPVPPAQAISVGREDLAKMQQAKQQVPPPLVLMFAMAQGTVKLMPIPMDRGWVVVSLTKIEPGKVPDDQLLDEAQKQLGTVRGDEYADALRRSIRAEVGVKQNASTIEAVRKQLAGGG